MSQSFHDHGLDQFLSGRIIIPPRESDGTQKGEMLLELLELPCLKEHTFHLALV